MVEPASWNPADMVFMTSAARSWACCFSSNLASILSIVSAHLNGFGSAKNILYASAVLNSTGSGMVFLAVSAAFC
jgi:hypothetical protein